MFEIKKYFTQFESLGNFIANKLLKKFQIIQVISKPPGRNININLAILINHKTVNGNVLYSFALHKLEST
jgi:hypothetical protein